MKYLLLNIAIEGSIDPSFSESEMLLDYVRVYQEGTSSTTIDTQVACDSYTWIDGITYTENNNTSTWLLTNLAGCDSLVTLDLTLNSSTYSEINETVSDSYTLNGTTYESSGTYTQTLSNVYGCDSIITLNLVVDPTLIINEQNQAVVIFPNPVKKTIQVQSEFKIDAIRIVDAFGKTYWLDESPFKGEQTIDVSFLPPGIYSLRATANRRFFDKDFVKL